MPYGRDPDFVDLIIALRGFHFTERMEQPQQAPNVPANLIRFEFYNGHGRPQLWLNSLTLKFNVLGIVDPIQRKTYAAAYLAGDALQWFMSKYEDLEEDYNWGDFKQDIIERFGVFNANHVARSKLATLKQEKSVRIYTSLFMKLLSDIDNMSDYDINFNYIKGLKPHIQEQLEVGSHDVLELTLSELTAKADRLDNIRHKFQNSSRGHARSSHSNAASTSHSSSAASSSSSSPSSSSSYSDSSSVPMELNKVKHMKLTVEERDRLRKLNACFYCREAGHKTQECPKLRRGKGKGKKTP